MGKCTSCGAALDPGWKFCIACGTAARVEVVDGEVPPLAHEPIPAAIRPDSDAEAATATRPRRPDLALILGIVLGIGGVLLIIVVVAALFTPHG